MIYLAARYILADAICHFGTRTKEFIAYCSCRDRRPRLSVSYIEFVIYLAARYITFVMRYVPYGTFHKYAGKAEKL